MSRFKLIDVCCLIGVCSFPAAATPVAVSQITADLSTARIAVNEGGNVTAGGIMDPLFGYMFQSGSDFVESPSSPFPSPANSVTVPLSGGSSISAQSINGASLTNAAATVLEGDAYASSTVNSYFIYTASDVTSLTFSLDFNATMLLSTEAEGEYASGQWMEFLDLFSIYEPTGELIPIICNPTSISANQIFQDAFDGNVLTFDERHTLDVSYGFSEAFNGRLVLQSTIIADALVSAPATSIPEPSQISLMVLGLAMFLPLVKRRKV